MRTIAQTAALFPQTVQFQVPASVAAAIFAANAEKQAARDAGVSPDVTPFHQPAESRGEQIEMVASVDILEAMVAGWGARRVSAWLRYVVAQQGQEA